MEPMGRFSICMLAVVPFAAHAEIVDRIAVSIGNRVITQSDLEREIRITGFLNGQKPDFSAAGKREAAERMVDQTLVRNELEASEYLLPSAADTDTALKEEKGRFADEAAYRKALASYGVSEEDLKARLLWQLTLLRFIEVRFRPGIQIGDDQITKYFNEHLRSMFMEAHPGQVPSIDDYRDSVEQTLIGQSANEQVEQWLKEARKRTRIHYHDEVFQ
jgi:hypothetical protein